MNCESSLEKKIALGLLVTDITIRLTKKTHSVYKFIMVLGIYSIRLSVNVYLYVLTVDRYNIYTE